MNWNNSFFKRFEWSLQKSLRCECNTFWWIFFPANFSQENNKNVCMNSIFMRAISSIMCFDHIRNVNSLRTISWNCGNAKLDQKCREWAQKHFVWFYCWLCRNFNAKKGSRTKTMEDYFSQNVHSAKYGMRCIFGMRMVFQFLHALSLSLSLSFSAVFPFFSL